MTSKTRVLVAFILNISFSLIELVCGLLFHSSALISDAVHDAGDAVSIGFAALMENLADKPANKRFTMGYQRFSLLGALATGTILVFGSVSVLVFSIPKLFTPQPVNYSGMLILGLFAVATNVLATLVLKKGHSHNEKILSLHFLEDTLGWLALILVSIILHFKDWYVLDPLLSVLISGFMLTKSLPELWKCLLLFLQACPQDLDTEQLQKELLSIVQIKSLSALQIWSMDGSHHKALVRLTLKENTVTNQELTKEKIRQRLLEHGISEVTIDIECKV